MANAIFEIILSILANIFGDAFDEWYSRQRWWVKTIVIGSFVFAVLMILYFIILLPIFRSAWGGS